MIGVVVITHGGVGTEMVMAAELIKGDMQNIISVSVDATKSVEVMEEEITAAVEKADTGRGVLILTDLFGGTPSNISLSFLKEGKVEVLTGVNLPMLLRVSEIREEKSLAEFAVSIKDYGKKNIYLASEILKRKVAN
jgi:PTS system mannose-specific IIA component